MSKMEHGAQRAGLITASIARTIMSGSPSSWDSLIERLWADDGSQFAQASQGARAFGHENEDVGRGLFWERNPHLEVDEPGFQPFSRPGFGKGHPYRSMLGYSPDSGVIETKTGERIGGLEIKSPTTEGTWRAYAAHCSRLEVPPEHKDQVYFSLWAGNWRRWYFVAHFKPEDGEHLYCQTVVGQDAMKQSGWVQRFRPKLDAFIDLYRKGVQAERDKLNAGGLAALLRS